MTEREKQIVNEAIAELETIMEVSLGQMAKDLVKSALGRSVRTKDPMFWPAGMLMLGLAEARKKAALDGEEGLVGRIDEAFLGHIRLWKEKYELLTFHQKEMRLCGECFESLDGIDCGTKSLSFIKKCLHVER